MSVYNMDKLDEVWMFRHGRNNLVMVKILVYHEDVLVNVTRIGFTEDIS